MHPAAFGSSRNSRLFGHLAQFPEFYLAGGTALALQIGHRVSVDFGLFSPELIRRTILLKAERLFAGEKIAVSANNRDECTIFAGGTKFTFLHYPFPVFTRFVSYRGVRIMSVKEIAATKAYTIGRRGSYKDYVDLYEVFERKYATLGETIALAERKYGEHFNARLFLEQLIYLEDVRDTQIVFLRRRTSKEVIRVFFERAVSKIRL